jgi:predicted dehydrogenase
LENIRWGIIAPGRIAHTFAKAFSAINDGEIVAVASRNVERAQQFADEYSIPTVYDSYQSLINSPLVDAVYVANPHSFHYDIVELCLKAGKPTLCEKPLSVNAYLTESLIELANNTNTFLMEALWSRFLPCWTKVKETVESGQIGRIDAIYSTFGFVAERNMDDRLFNLDLAGGTLLDLGVYNLSLSQFLLGNKIESIESHVVVGETGVDEKCTATVTFPGEHKPTAQFTCSFLNNLDNSMQINGSLGRIVIEGTFLDAKKATVILNNGDEILIEEPYRATGFEYEIEEAHRCIRNNEIQSDIIPHVDTLTTIRLIDQILLSNGVNYPFARYS